MKPFNNEQSNAWIGGWLPVGTILDVKGPAPTDALFRRSFQVPDGAAPVHAVLRVWVSWLIADRADLLVWVDEYGVWESSEDWNLYDRWRRSAGVSGRLKDQPGHLFGPHESADAVSLLLMARLFGWGFRAVAREARRAVRIDHDGHGLVVAADTAALSDAPF